MLLEPIISKFWKLVRDLHQSDKVEIAEQADHSDVTQLSLLRLCPLEDHNLMRPLSRENRTWLASNKLSSTALV